MPKNNEEEARVHIKGFPNSEIPPRETKMDNVMIRSLAESEKPLDQKAMDKATKAHLLFLDSGGRGGYFKRLNVSGLSLNVYEKHSEDGKQLVMRSKSVKKGVSLAGKDLSYADFSGGIYEGVDFTGANLEGSILTNAFFSNAIFNKTNCTNVDFTDSDLRNVSFKEANLRKADFEIANCEGANFIDSDLTGATFPGANLKGIKY